MPWIDHPEKERFLEILQRLDFDRKYYGFVDTYADKGIVALEDRKRQEKALKTLGITYRFSSSERFFRHEAVDPGKLLWRLHFVFRPGAQESKWGAAFANSLELGLYLNTPKGDLGGTVHGLAKDVAERRSAGFSREPPFPRLPYSNEEGMVAAVNFGHVLFQSVRSALREEAVW